MTTNTIDNPVAIGTELPPLQLPPITRPTIALFAGASGDHHPIHLDPDLAKEAGMPDVFAHGMLSMAYLGRLLTECFPQNRIRRFHVRFTAITPLHGQPTCTGRVTAIEEGSATIELTATLSDGTVTLLGDAIVDIRKASHHG